MKKLKRRTAKRQKKLNFSNHAKLDQVLDAYDECEKPRKYDQMNEVFDITKENGEWPCNKVKRFYYLHIKNKRCIGCTTGKAKSSKTIHPSKRIKMLLEPTSTTSESETDRNAMPENSEEQSASTSKKYNKTNLVTSSKLSTICRQ